MNDKSYTYLHPATGHLSSLDLSLCHPSLFLDFDWSVYADQCGSDHFPVIIESVNNSTNDHNTKWKLNKANWELYYSLCEEGLKIDKFDNSLDPLDDFTSSLLDIANKCIPKTSTNPKKSKPWYNDECKDAIKQRKQALSKFCRYPTKENLNNVKNFRAKARRTIKASKRKSWKSDVSNLNNKIPIKQVWDMIRKISGKSKSPSFTHLNTKRGTKATSKEEIANTLGETFLDNSSSRNYSEKFQNIKKQDIINCLDYKTDGSLYVDDFCICFRSKNMRTIEIHLQQCLNRIEDWATRNGFKFSKSKTQCVHFYIYGSQIPVGAESKFLGVIFDKKLSFIPHIKYLKAKCLKALNLLKVLSHTSWGADRTTLLHLYRSLIRSKLDYGSIIYGSARKSYLQMLDTVHNQGLRLALGAFRTSPVSSLNVEADEPSLWLRRETLSLQFAIRVAANPSNPAFEVAFPPQFQEYYERKPNAIKSFGLRIAPLLESTNINIKNIQKHSFSDIPSWCITKPTILFDLHNSRKSLPDSYLMKQNFQELQSRLSDYQHIYTDGSKVEDKVGCAYISGSHHEKIRLPDGSSIFTAESKAIDMALDYVMNNSLENKFVIFSDSLSVLKSLNHTTSKNPKIQNVIEKHHELSKTKEILFCWLPSHVGIKGNEAADVKAKASLDPEISNFKLPCTDFKPFINVYILSKWQLSWDRATFNKLHEIKPVLGKNTIYRSLRREEVVLTRLRIGHTRLTHSYLLKREDQPFCISCNEPFTVKHFLIDCIEFSHMRRQFFQTNDLRYLFENVPTDNILMFLKHINIFKKV